MFGSSDSGRRKEQTMKRAKDATLVLCLFVVYCVLLAVCFTDRQFPMRPVQQPGPSSSPPFRWSSSKRRSMCR
jgi:hypothetical protein